jgi:hypothetical protein
MLRNAHGMVAGGLNGERLYRDELTLGCRDRQNLSKAVPVSGGHAAADTDFALDRALNY